MKIASKTKTQPSITGQANQPRELWSRKKANDYCKTNGRQITTAKWKANYYRMTNNHQITITGQEANHYRNCKATYYRTTKDEQIIIAKRKANHHRTTKNNQITIKNTRQMTTLRQIIIKLTLQNERQSPISRRIKSWLPIKTKQWWKKESRRTLSPRAKKPT